jgi:hypothetical protein
MSRQTFGVFAGAYLRGDKRRAFLIHVCEVDDQGAVTRVLCGRVKPENICNDVRSPSSGQPSTCVTCRRLANGVKPGTPLGTIIRRGEEGGAMR